MKKFSVILIALMFVLGVCPAFSAAANEETLAVYTQDFTNIESVREDFSAYYVYDLGAASEYDSIGESLEEEGNWYLNTDTNGDSQITRKNRVGQNAELDSADGTKEISILTFKRQKFVNFELEVDFKRGTATTYWAGVAIRQLTQGKYFLEDGAGIFNQQEGTTTLWGTDGVGGPHEDGPISGFKPNEYHHMKVVCNGLSLEISINGNVTMSRTLPRSFFRNGYVSLVSVNNDCSFKNFKIKELPIERLPAEEEQNPVIEADSENSLTNLSQLPPAERVSVSTGNREGLLSVWSILAIVTGCTALAAVTGFTVVLIIKLKRMKHRDVDKK